MILGTFSSIWINRPRARLWRNSDLKHLTPELDILFKEYEKGSISSPQFLEEVSHHFPIASEKELIDAWNAILKDFPDSRLEFVENLAKEADYRLFLLSKYQRYTYRICKAGNGR